MLKNVNKRNLAVLDEVSKRSDVQTKRVPLGNISCNPDVGEIGTANFGAKYSRQSAISTCSNKSEKENVQIVQDKGNLNQNKYGTKVWNIGEPHKKYIFQKKDQELLDKNKIAPAPCKKYSLVLSQDICSSTSTSNHKEISVLGAGQEKKKVKNKDLIWRTTYIKDIYVYLRSIEQKFQPEPYYMKMQREINMDMRSILVDWLVEVGEEYKLHTETLFLAVSYLDRFLSQMTVPKDKLQLVGITSMFLSAKYEEIYPPELTEFVYITDNTYDKKQILKMEFLLLKVLNFDLTTPTAYYFLKLYCSVNCASQAVKDLSQCICELSLLDGDRFLKLSPSMIAAGSLALANYALSYVTWNKDLVEFSGYKASELMNVMLLLRDKYISMESCPQRATMEKYKSSKYGCCSSMTLSEDFFSPED